MTRWTAVALTALAAASIGLARADAVRSFPDTALRGSLQVVTPPAVVLDGRDDRLAMGARIRDQRNLVVTSATLADGSTHAVNYVRDDFGLISQVWLLTDAEAAVKRPSANPTLLQRWFGL